MTDLETARDAVSLWQILPGRSNPSRRALRALHDELCTQSPSADRALSLATDALGASPQDGSDAAELALLEVAARLLLTVGWTLHDGGPMPVPDETLVEEDLDGADVLIERAGALDWGPGSGPDGAGRIHRWRVVELLRAHA